MLAQVLVLSDLKRSFREERTLEARTAVLVDDLLESTRLRSGDQEAPSFGSQCFDTTLPFTLPGTFPASTICPKRERRSRAMRT